MKSKRRAILIIAIIIILLLIVFRVWKAQNVILRQFYPMLYKTQVEKYAKEYDIDKLYIYAIIKAESNFNEKANSQSGAKGLMQIMDSTAKDIAKTIGINNEEEFDLYNPSINIMLGTKYFSDLLKEYNGNIDLALAAYNAGKGNIKKWIENGIIKADGSDIENIPYKETNMYVRKIKQNYKMYQDLYKGKVE